MKPTFPLISIYKTIGLDLLKTENAIPDKTSVFTIISQQQHQCIMYDANANCWDFSFVNDQVKNDFKTRLLANTIYNPVVEADIKWEYLGRYDLEELKKSISICIDKDDDVITQFEEGDFIKVEILKCKTFEEIILVLDKYVFEVNEEKLWEEQDKRETNRES